MCAALALVLALALASPTPSVARGHDEAPFPARAGLALATAAATAWAPDAYLVYVENDEPLGADGVAPRWGYLFHSPSLDRSRAWSLAGGKIVTAENLAMAFAAPPVAGGWIDSDTARRAGEAAAQAFCHDQGGRLTTMLLLRGAFDDADPDATTWTLVFTAPKAPSLFVMVDAADGKVRRTWRG
jgi:hypothetical protein